MGRKRQKDEQSYSKGTVEGKVPDHITKRVIDKEYGKNTFKHTIAILCVILAIVSAFFHIDGGDVDFTLKGFGALNGGFAAAFLFIAAVAIFKTQDPDIKIKGQSEPKRTSTPKKKGGKKS